MYTHNQALRLFRAHGVRVPVALSPAAQGYIARHPSVLRRSVAGLNELSAVSNPAHKRGIFETLTAFHARELSMRSAVRAHGYIAGSRSYAIA